MNPREPRLDGGPETDLRLVLPADQKHCYGCTNETRELCDEVTRLRAENERLKEAARLTIEALDGSCDIKDCWSCRAYLSAKEALNDKAVEK